MPPTSDSSPTSFYSSSHFLTRWLFLRMLGFVYLSALLSLWLQIDGLIGPNGILPLDSFQQWALRYAKTRYGSASDAFWLWPGLTWLDYGSPFLHLLFGVGVLCAFLLVVGVFQRYMLIVLWLLYLSIFHAGQTFLAFQWDLLLLEVGFVSIFLAPWHTDRAGTPPPRWVLWLLWWVLFRLMFFSGWVKLASQDATWRDLTALTFHYWTQPLPHPMSWYAHHLPLWLHKLSTAAMFAIEMGAPFLIVFGRRPRLIAFLLLVLLQFLIGLTGNYGYFNLLTAVLCLSLLDDRQIGALLPRQKHAALLAKHTSASSPSYPLQITHRVLTGAAVFFLFFSSLSMELMRFRRHPKIGHWVRWMDPYKRLNKDQTFQRKIQKWYIRIRRLRLHTRYGLFAGMTTRRPELSVEGSADGKTWKVYRFRWKPGHLKTPPQFAGLHMPRLDWQMWFAALRNRPPAWLIRFSQRLLQTKKPVLGLLANNPFPTLPPQYIRIRKYQYTFSEPFEKAKKGIWWKRNQPKMFFGPYSLRR